ncbi:Proteasome subunit beta type-7 [Quaeritorhiza haematococci]|nr:Proteasome subunit beta type-7 [Quaeritorhiza haematococci]
MAGPMKHTQSPIVTGTSVIGIKYKDGVMLAADCLASYGSLARFRDVERLTKVGDHTVVGASGDISDYQYIQHMLESQLIKEYYLDDGHKMSAPNVFEFLSRVLYNRRSQFNPLWNSLIVAGCKPAAPAADDAASSLPERFLGYVDLQGTTYHAPSIATGYGGYIAQPLLRKALEGGREDTMTEEEAKKLLEDCMRVLYYRDARSMNKIQIATINAEAVKISEPYSLATEWGFAEYVRGYGA